MAEKVKMKKSVKITIWVSSVLVGLMVLLLLVSLIAGSFMYDLALNPYSDKREVFSADHNSYDVSEEQKALMAEHKAWFDNSGYTTRTLTSEDGLKLNAYAIETPDYDKWAILCHGYSANGKTSPEAAKQFYENGYNVLLPDARGHGESEGDYVGMGWHERRDIVGWINSLLEVNPDSQIVLYGVSMGGATVMMTSGEKLPSNVKAIIEDCGYSSVWDEFAHQLKSLFHLPTFPILDFANMFANSKAGYDFKEASAVEQVKKSVTPIMFIHGDEDTFVPFSMLDKVFDAATCPKKKLVVKGAGHALASLTLGQMYWDEVFDFIGNYVA